MGSRGRPAIFLDRDGTVNMDRGYLCRKEDVQYLDGAVDALRRLCGMGFLLVIITNQSGVARGYYTEQDLRELHRWMKADLERRGVAISGIYYCPHCTEGKVGKYIKKCGCRKPATGLFWKAREELGIDMGRSFAVGDRVRDLWICRESGVRGILLSEDGTTGKQAYPLEDSMRGGQIEVCKNWGEALCAILRQHKNREGCNGESGGFRNREQLENIWRLSKGKL